MSSVSSIPPEYNASSVKPAPPSEVEEASATAKDAAQRQKWFEDMRGWIMVVAVLVASITYTTGLNPPGGFWQDDSNGHKAGVAIMPHRSPFRYTVFFNANATAFIASLVIIILLMNEKYYCDKSKVVMLNLSMLLGLVSLMLAYAVGCTVRISTTIYVIALALGVLLFVIYSAQLLPGFCSCMHKHAPCLLHMLGHGYVPKTEGQSSQNTFQNLDV